MDVVPYAFEAFDLDILEGERHGQIGQRQALRLHPPCDPEAMGRVGRASEICLHRSATFRDMTIRHGTTLLRNTLLTVNRVPEMQHDRQPHVTRS